MDTYSLLLTGLRRRLGLPDAVPDDGRLLVDGTEIALSRETGEQGEHLWICVDFGAVPAAQARLAYRTMLEMNLRAGAPEAGLLALEATGRAALLVRHPLTAGLQPDGLAAVLVRYAALAKRWLDDLGCDARPQP